jgi:hypothetical protein
MRKETIDDISKYLEGQGVGYLTSESCGIGIRALYDYSERGKRLLEMFFGTTISGAPWNSTVGNEPSVGSIMLPREMVRPLAIFAMFMNGATAVVDVDISGDIRANYLMEIRDIDGWDDPDYQELLEKVRYLFNGKFKVWTNTSTGREGRNVHVFSQRTV